MQDEAVLIVSRIWSKFLDPAFGPTKTNQCYQMRNFPDSYTSAAIINWLVTNGHVPSRYMHIAMYIVANFSE